MAAAIAISLELWRISKRKIAKSQALDFNFLAKRALRKHRSPFIPPTIKKSLVLDDAEQTNSLTIEDAFNSIESLTHELTSAHGRGSRTLILVGAAGQGKSRLAAEITSGILRRKTAAILIRKSDLDSICTDEETEKNPIQLITKVAHGRMGLALVPSGTPIIIDGWNEIETAYEARPALQGLNALVSGASKFPVLVTSRRHWWETQQEYALSRSLHVYHVEPFDQKQRDAFVRQRGISPSDFDSWLQTCDLSDLCDRPFFLEQSVELFEMSPHERPVVKGRASLMLAALEKRFEITKAAVRQAAYPSNWPSSHEMLVAVLLASLQNDNGWVDKDTVSDLLKQHFKSVPIETLVDVFLNSYLMDSFDETSPDRFVYAHDTLRDFSFALLWRHVDIPDFALFDPRLEHLPGYWIGLQPDPSAAAARILERYGAEYPHIATDILAANGAFLSPSIYRLCWQIVGYALAGRRSVRDAAIEALADLPSLARREALANGLLEPVRQAWPHIVIEARNLLTRVGTTPEQWQSLTRLGARRAQQRFQPATSSQIDALRRRKVPVNIIDRVQSLKGDHQHYLLGLLNNESYTSEFRAGAAIALGTLHVPDASGAIRQHLLSQDPNIKAACALSSGVLADFQAIPTLRKIVNDHPTVTFRAIMALARLNDTSSIPIVMAHLRNHDWVIVAAAATALGKLRARSAVPELMQIVGTKHSEAAVDAVCAEPTKDHPSVIARGSAITALGLIGEQSCFECLVNCLSSDENWQNRSAAAIALARLGNRSALPHLERVASSQEEDQRTRSAAATSIGRLGGSGRTLETLIAILRSLEGERRTNQISRLRAALVAAIGKVGGTKAQPIIKECLADEDEHIRFIAATVIPYVGSAGLMPAVCEYLMKETSYINRRDILRNLDSIRDGNSDVEEVFYLLAKSPPPQLASRAIRSIARFGQGPAAISTLVQIAEGAALRLDKTEAIAGLARLNSLVNHFEIIRHGEKDAEVRGVLCRYVLREAAMSRPVPHEIMAAVIHDLSGKDQPSNTVLSGLAVFDNLTIDETRNLIGRVRPILDDVESSDLFRDIWRRKTESLATREQYVADQAALMMDAKKHFANYVCRH